MQRGTERERDAHIWIKVIRVISDSFQSFCLEGCTFFSSRKYVQSSATVQTLPSLPELCCLYIYIYILYYIRTEFHEQERRARETRKEVEPRGETAWESNLFPCEPQCYMVSTLAGRGPLAYRVTRRPRFPGAVPVFSVLSPATAVPGNVLGFHCD